MNRWFDPLRSFIYTSSHTSRSTWRLISFCLMGVLKSRKKSRTLEPVLFLSFISLTILYTLLKCAFSNKSSNTSRISLSEFCVNDDANNFYYLEYGSSVS